MDKHDIVYILRNDIDTDEIKYSLRSVAKNFPHNKVWIYGGCPDGIIPDEYVEFHQTGSSRYEKVTNTIKAVCENDDITPSFWLFNDDFFVLRPVESMMPTANGSIRWRMKEIQKKRGMISKYAKRLGRTGELLHRYGYDSLNYAVHVPMLIDRAKGLEVLTKFNGEPMFRCLYGNYVREQTVIMPDVKVVGDEEPDKARDFLSTDDSAWQSNAGKYIRNKFRGKCKYEAST